METILVTGSSWFIGFHTAKTLLERWEKVIWIDNENDYYDPGLKRMRRDILEGYPNFEFHQVGIEDFGAISEIFKKNQPDKVLNLAAQAGVRYSLIDPFAYVRSNLVGFHNVIELSKQHGIKNFVYASSSSVYGNNVKQPYSVDDAVDHPISLYAATKKSNELIAHSYSHLFSLPTTWLRFFTVYWPYWRPDMAYFSFADKILKGETIDVFNHWKSKRDFMYVDDIVDGIIKCLDKPFPYQIFNLWNDNPCELERMISIMESELGKRAKKNYLPMQSWDVPSTWADVEKTKELIGWQPQIRIEEGMEITMRWLKDYFAKQH